MLLFEDGVAEVAVNTHGTKDNRYCFYAVSSQQSAVSKNVGFDDVP